MAHCAQKVIVFTLKLKFKASNKEHSWIYITFFFVIFIVSSALFCSFLNRNIFNMWSNPCQTLWESFPKSSSCTCGLNRDRLTRFEVSPRPKNFLHVMSFGTSLDEKLCKQNLFTMFTYWARAVCLHFMTTWKIKK